MSKYRWIPNGSACSTCQGMATTTYPTPPQRPHDACQCSYASLTGNSSDGMTDPIPRIIGLKRVGGGCTYDTGGAAVDDYVKNTDREDFSAHCEFEYEATILCPNNQEVSLNVNVVLDDSDVYDAVTDVFSLKETTMYGADGEVSPDPDDMDDFEQEIQEAIDDYSGGVDLKARTQVAEIIMSGSGPCSDL